MSTTITLQQQAAALKEEGNEYFKLKKFDRAIEIYSKCIELDPNSSVYYSNRSVCYQNISDFKSMINDAKQSIQLDPSFSKGYFRLAKGLIELKRYGKAYQVLYQALHNNNSDRGNSSDNNTDSVGKQQQPSSSSSQVVILSREEKTTFETELNKCLQKLQEEQAIWERTQNFINPFSTTTSISNSSSSPTSASRKIEMEMRREFYLNHFVKKEHKILIIEKLDDILKPMKGIVKRVGNLNGGDGGDSGDLNESNNKDGKVIMLGEKEQELINEEYNNRALPTSCFNWRYQVKSIEPMVRELQEVAGIGILEICAVILVFFSKPEVSCTLLKRILKQHFDSSSNTGGSELSIVENKIHAYILLAQSHLFWKGVVTTHSQQQPTNKPLQYLRSALELIRKNKTANSKKSNNYTATVNHILTWTYINLIQQCYTVESNLSDFELENLMEDFNQLLFILDSSELIESSHISTICQDGIRFWFASLQRQHSAFDQFQRISLLSDKEVVPLVDKIFNEFHSANLALPKQCLNKFFLNALSESLLLLRTNMEPFLRNIRLGLLSLIYNYITINTNNKDNLLLEPSMHSLHYALALQCFHNRYCFKKTENENDKLLKCIGRFDELVVVNYNLSSSSQPHSSSRMNLLEHSELHDLFLVISMYGSVIDLCESFTQFEKIIQLNHRDYPYLLTKLLNHTVRITKKIKSSQQQQLSDETTANTTTTIDSLLLDDYYSKSLSIIENEDSLSNSSNLITSTLKINKEIEWMSNNEYWSQGFDNQSTTNVLLIKDAIDLGDCNKYLQRYQSCTVTALEMSSDFHYNFLKDVLLHTKKEAITLMRRAVVNDSQLLEQLSTIHSIFSILEASSLHLFKHQKTLHDLIETNLREGGIVKLSIPSQFQIKFVKDVRNCLMIQSASFMTEKASTLLERDEFDHIPKLIRAPTRNELVRARELLSRTPPFAEQLFKLSEFYNLNSFADLIFSPLWNDMEGGGFSFQQMSQFVESTLGLRIIYLSTNLMPFQRVLPEYIEETKDVKCRDWKAMDSFANSNPSHFISPIHVVCEKPMVKKSVQDIIVDRKKDPLGLKKYLHKLSNK